MIIILEKTILYWTGILTGFLFIFSFLGCCCNSNCNIFPKKLRDFSAKHHKSLIYLAFIAFIMHAGLGILSGFGIYL